MQNWEDEHVGINTAEQIRETARERGGGGWGTWAWPNNMADVHGGHGGGGGSEECA